MSKNEKTILNSMANRLGVSVEILAQRAERICYRRKVDAHRAERSTAKRTARKSA
jgi:hypothetical protein